MSRQTAPVPHENGCRIARLRLERRRIQRGSPGPLARRDRLGAFRDRLRQSAGEHRFVLRGGALNILLTGATGKVGRHVTEGLVASGHHVRALTRPRRTPRRPPA
ncbi:hypothetical protein SVIOM342S_09858 [Streptomyces violaceorubidus]